MLQFLKTLSGLAIFLLPFIVFGQIKSNYTINGTIRDQQTGEILIGASISLGGKSIKSAVSNAYGFYSITAQTGNYRLIASFSGYQSDTMQIELNKNMELLVNLSIFKSQLQEVVINSRKKNENIVKPIMGIQKLSTNEIKNIPVLSKDDALKLKNEQGTIFLLKNKTYILKGKILFILDSNNQLEQCLYIK